jgi:glutathione S-transferase
MFRSCVFELFESVRSSEKAYFRSTRERLFGQSLEAVAAGAERNIAEMREARVPMRIAPSRMPYLGGETPNYADHIAWAALVGFA